MTVCVILLNDSGVNIGSSLYYYLCVTELDNTIEQASADSQSDKEKSQRREQDLQQQMMRVMWFARLNQYVTVYWLQWFCLCSLVVWLVKLKTKLNNI